jgi:hypothetical protein
MNCTCYKFDSAWCPFHGVQQMQPATTTAHAPDAIPREIHERMIAERDAEIERLRRQAHDTDMSAHAAIIEEKDCAEAAERALAGAKAQALREAAEEIAEELRLMASEYERGG